MDPEVVTDRPGICPKCGMDLVPQPEPGKAAERSHAMMHGGPDAAADFFRRFLIVTVLLVPLLLLTKTGVTLLRLGDFEARRYLQFIVASGIFYFALIFFQHAHHEIKAKKYGMMTLVSLAVGAGYLFSATSTFLPALEGVEFYLEISTLIWVLLFGHWLEAKSSAAAGDALQEVAKLLPKQAHLFKNGKIEDVDLSLLKEGDTVLVKPGEKMPADGIIIKGKANLDESLISGESKPVEKGKDEEVVAGSICLDGSLEIKLSRVGENSLVGQIQKLISQAQQTKPSAQKLADRVASWLTFSALTVAILTVVVWSLVFAKPLVFALTLAITVLVIACPHALGLAIPTVSTIATTLAVKNGLFLKDLAKLEVVKNINYVIFDKTGTLTKGEFGVTAIKSKIKEEKNLLTMAASLEQHSSHFIAAAVVKLAQKQRLSLLKVADFKNFSGRGVEGKINGQDWWLGNKIFSEEKGLALAELEKTYQELTSQGKTVILFGSSKTVLGLLALSDQIRPESRRTVAALHHLGIKVAMLTGDNEQVGKAVAKELKIDTYFANVLPEDKYKYVKKLQDQGKKVMMVGDGVNDAPAITSANIGVAVGAGTDVAVEAGDMVLTRNNPEDIAKLVILSKKVYRKMAENLIWATGYNLLAIPAAAGLFSPWGIFLRPEFGAILMSLSSVIVVANALLLRRTKLETFN